MTPITIARGLNRSFPADDASTAGKRGKMQGDKILTIPAPNAARRVTSKDMVLKVKCSISNFIEFFQRFYAEFRFTGI
jgi:hypothetical protein